MQIVTYKSFFFFKFSLNPNKTRKHRGVKSLFIDLNKKKDVIQNNFILKFSNNL